MWWPERVDRTGVLGPIVRAAAGILLAAGLSGCFTPLYGDPAVTVAPGTGPGLRTALRTVDIQQIDAPKGSDDARIAVEIRNSLIYSLTGGSDPLPPTYRLMIRTSSTLADIIVDTTTTRPSIENYGINATYYLIEIGSGKQVVTGQTFARVSYDIPGQEQRFARLRGLRDAETRAAKVIADNIRARLAAYFTAGT
jgi:LPS-assembly lipoprotein